jgi:hypothetical protein
MTLTFISFVSLSCSEPSPPPLMPWMNTTRQQVSDLEIGQAPTIATLFRVAQALQIAPAGLVLIAENRQRHLAHRLSVLH